MAQYLKEFAPARLQQVGAIETDKSVHPHSCSKGNMMKTNIKAKGFSLAAAVIGIYLLAAPAYATCGVNGYWGNECGPQTPSNPGNTTNTLTGGDNTATGGAGGNASSDATAGAVGVGVGVGTGGNATTGPIDVTTGPTTATGGQGGAGGSVGDTTATSGSTSTATGGSSVAGVTGSGNSSSSSTSGVSGSGNSTNSTTVNNTNKTRIKHAASMAAPVMMGGYGPGNCFGDTNPSGQFGTSIQTFGWGVTANSSKASNTCAMVAIAGPKAALSYLANVDPNVRRALLANGLAEKPSQRKARLAAEAEDAPTKNVRPSQTVRCPAGSAWDGKGCWAKNLKAVSR